MREMTEAEYADLDQMTIREGIVGMLIDNHNYDHTNYMYWLRKWTAKVQASTPLNIDTPFPIDFVDDILLSASIG